MNKAIFKIQLNPVWNTPQEVTLPKGAKPLHCANQHGVPTIWFEINKKAEPGIAGSLRMIGTGADFEYDDTETYLGTILLMDGTTVAHVLWTPAKAN